MPRSLYESGGIRHGDAAQDAGHVFRRGLGQFLERVDADFGQPRDVGRSQAMHKGQRQNLSTAAGAGEALARTRRAGAPDG